MNRATLALARVEAGLFLRHPLFLAATGLALVAQILVPLGDGDLERTHIVTGAGLLPMTAAVMMVAALASSRRRRDRIEGPDDPYPLSAANRARAQLLAVCAAPVVGLVLMAPVWLFYLGSDGGLTVGEVRWLPGIPDLIQGPLLVATFSLAGVAIGLRWVAPWIPVVLALAMVWSPLAWFNPWIVTDPSIGDPQQDLVASASWQVVYLGGIAVAACAAALARAERRVAWHAVTSAALAAAAAGGILRFA